MDVALWRREVDVCLHVIKQCNSVSIKGVARHISIGRLWNMRVVRPRNAFSCTFGPAFVRCYDNLQWERLVLRDSAMSANPAAAPAPTCWYILKCLYKCRMLERNDNIFLDCYGINLLRVDPYLMCCKRRRTNDGNDGLWIN